MRKSLFFSLLTLFVLVAGIVYMFKVNSLPAITYFPIDEKNTFEDAHSELEFTHRNNNDSYDVTWTSSSKSSQSMYLRQDASLLFANGRLRGIRSKWVEDTASIQLKEKLHSKDDNFFQIISYHHGEIHYPDDEIKSIQHMSHDALYVIKSATNKFNAFRSPENDEESNKKSEFDKATKKQLLYQWKQLLTHFNINEASYIAVPLTHLYTYNEKELPGTTQEETDQIIGQLWEGLYKNYIVPAANTKKNTSPNYVPLILFDKDQSHLIVLFELNGKKEKLIQKYPDF